MAEDDRPIPVRRTLVGELFVSTVDLVKWLPRLSELGDPTFESAVLDPDFSDLWQVRSYTREEALALHEEGIREALAHYADIDPDVTPIEMTLDFRSISSDLDRARKAYRDSRKDAA